MSNHNPMSIHDEYISIALVTEAEGRQAASTYSNWRAEETVRKMVQNDYINDHSHMLRGADGKVHDRLRDDTMVTISGVEMTYLSAKEAGLIKGFGSNADVALSFDTEPRETPEQRRAVDASVAPMSPALEGQNRNAEMMIGAQDYESALRGDSNAIAELTKRAGCTQADTVAMLNETNRHYLGAALRYVAQRVPGFSKEHFAAFAKSSAVESVDINAAMFGLRSGSVAGVEKLVHLYRTHYRL